jgi:hypothetical protein
MILISITGYYYDYAHCLTRSGKSRLLNVICGDPKDPKFKSSNSTKSCTTQPLLLRERVEVEGKTFTLALVDTQGICDTQEVAHQDKFIFYQ